MPLVVSLLKSGLKSALETQLAAKGPVKVPKITPALAAAWGAAYHAYASAALCGIKTASGGDPSKVEAGLLGADYLDGWEKGVKDYWDAVKFGGDPLYIPKNPASSSGITALKTDVRALLADPAGSLGKTAGMTLDAFAGKLAAVLDKHTLKVTVDTTTKPPPPPAVNVPKDSIS